MRIDLVDTYLKKNESINSFVIQLPFKNDLSRFESTYKVLLYNIYLI